jgi:hypothetical protein
VEELKPALILPDHSPPGDSAMIPEQRAYMIDLLAQTQSAKSQGKSVEDAAGMVGAEFGTKYAGWLRAGNLPRAVSQAYREAQ